MGGDRLAPQRGAKAEGSPSLPLAAAAALLLVGAAGVLGAQERRPNPLRVREVFVPYREFHRLSGTATDGVVVTLAEYRELLRAAFARIPPAEPDLPPIGAAVVNARYEGRVEGDTVRVEGRLDVRVTRDGWVVCPLAPLPAAIGSVLADGRPGWLVLHPPRSAGPRRGEGAAAAERQAATPSQKAAQVPGHESSQGFLLLRGKGRHEVLLRFSLRIARSEDRRSLEALLPRAETALFALEVPGRIEIEDGGLPLGIRSPAGEDRTLVHIPLGANPKVSLSWRRKRASGAPETYLEAEHALVFDPRIADPRLSWDAKVKAARRPVSELRFLPPEGCEVVQVAGELVHSHRLEGESVVVLLNEPLSGETGVRFECILAPIEEEGGAARFRLRPPALKGAYINRGLAAVLDPEPDRVEIVTASGLDELAPDEAPIRMSEGRTAARLYAFAGEGALLEVRSQKSPSAYAWEASLALIIGEGRAELTGIYRVEPIAGRLYRLRLTHSPDWEFEALEPVGGSDIPFRYEPAGGASPPALDFEFARALEAQKTFAFAVRFRHRTWTALLDWDLREISIACPVLEGAERSQARLAVWVRDTMDPEDLAEEGWARREDLPPGPQKGGAERPQFIRWQGDTEHVPVWTPPEGFRTVAYLVSERPEAEIRLALRHRPRRILYRMVHHVLALEEGLRIRSEVLLASGGRPVAALRVALPVPVEHTVHVLGEGIREVAPEAGPDGGNLRNVVFEKPWVGTRRLRIEYEAEHPPGDARPLVLPELEGAGLTGDAALVLQSAGSVEVEFSGGSGAIPESGDELPEPRAPWDGARTVGVWRLLREAQPGSLRTRVYPRERLLSSLVRRLELATRIDASGISRTQGHLLLGHTGLEHLPLVLAGDSRLIEVRVDGERIQAVRREPGGLWLIPLPPRSYSRIDLAYERPSPPSASRELGPQGVWTERGPEVPGISVGISRWEASLPSGYEGEIDPLRGNLTPTARTALPFLARLFAGAGAPGSGPPLEGTKIGGNPVLVLRYRSVPHSKRAPPVVFLAALGGMFALAYRRGLKPVWKIAILGAAAAVLLESALGRASPLLLEPAAAGFAAASAALLAALGLRRLARAVLERRTAILLVWLAALFCSSPIQAEEGVGEPLGAPDDVVLVPYSVDDLPELDPERLEVYVPAEKFQKLWRLAHPEPPEPERPPYDFVPASASYKVGAAGDAYLARGRIAFLVLVDDWVRIPLSVRRARLRRVAIDGREAGLIQDRQGAAVLLKGKGLRELDIELSGRVAEEVGSFHMDLELFGPSATFAEIELPRGAAPVVEGAPEGAVVRTREEGVLLAADLGRNPQVRIRWSFPGRARELASRLDSLSLASYTLERGGYSVERIERIEVAGRPVEALRFELFGDWEVRAVDAPDLAEWSLVEGNGTRRLELHFDRARRTFRVHIAGFARLGDEASPVAAASLEGAVRRRSFFALRHGGGRRWTAEALSGTERVTREEVAGALEVEPPPADRYHRIHGDGRGLTAAAAPTEGSVALAHEVLLLIEPDRAVLSGKTAFRVWGPGPRRLVLGVPGGWRFAGASGEGLAGAPGEREGRVALAFRSRAAGGNEVLWRFEKPFQALPEELEVPAVAVELEGEALREERAVWAVAAPASVEVGVAEMEGLNPLPLPDAFSWAPLPKGSTLRLAVRTALQEATARLVLSLSAPPARAAVTAVFVALPRPEGLIVSGRVRFRPVAGRIETVGFRLPEGAELWSLELPNQRSRRIEETARGVEIRTALVSPASRPIDIDLSYRLFRENGRLRFLPPVILGEDLTLEGIEMFAGVLQSAERHVEVRDTSGLVRAALDEAPFLPADAPRRRFLALYRAIRPAWSAEIADSIVQAAEEVGALVELAELVTVLSPDGIQRTRAEYSVRNRGLQFVDVELPAGARLWGVTLDGVPVTTSRAEGAGGRGLRLKIPVERVGPADPDAVLAVVYSLGADPLPALYGTVTLEAPKLPGTRIMETLWRIEVPKGYEVKLSGGNVQEIAESFGEARRVRSLLAEIERLRVTLESTTSEAIKDRAEANLAQLEQELSDHVEDLSEVLERDRRGLRAVPQEQLEEGRRWLEEGRKRRDALRAAQEEKLRVEQRSGEGVDRILETLQIPGRRWRTKALPEAAERGDAGPAGGSRAEAPEGAAAREAARRFLAVTPETFDAQVERTEASLPRGPGLATAARKERLLVVPGLETPPPRFEQVEALMLRHLGDEPRAELSVGRRGEWLRAVSWVGLAAIGGLLLLRIARRRGLRVFRGS